MSKQVDRVFNNCYCYCDHCGYNRIVDETNYTLINVELRSYGWVITRINKEYFDFCSRDCYNKFKGE